MSWKVNLLGSHFDPLVLVFKGWKKIFNNDVYFDLPVPNYLEQTLGTGNLKNKLYFHFLIFQLAPQERTDVQNVSMETTEWDGRTSSGDSGSIPFVVTEAVAPCRINLLSLQVKGHSSCRGEGKIEKKCSHVWQVVAPGTPREA